MTHDQTPNPQGAKRLRPEALEVAQAYAFKYGLPYEDIQ